MPQQILRLLNLDGLDIIAEGFPRLFLQPSKQHGPAEKKGTADIAREDRIRKMCIDVFVEIDQEGGAVGFSLNTADSLCVIQSHPELKVADRIRTIQQIHLLDVLI